jgi:threonine dehydrogenase-like Zn-dependent dehydrogenase
MFTTWRETLSYSRRMGIVSGARVVVIGSGGNGLAFAAHAHNLGAERVVMVGSARATALALRAGVTDYFEYGAPDVQERLRAAVGRTVDYAIDAVGKHSSGDLVLPLLRDDAVLGVYGIDDYGAISLHISRAAGSFRLSSRGYDEAETHQEVTDYYLQGKLDATLWFGGTGVWDLGSIGAAFDAVRARKSPKALVRLAG